LFPQNESHFQATMSGLGISLLSLKDQQLLNAAQAGNGAEVQRLIEAGADIKAVDGQVGISCWSAGLQICTPMLMC
jgi:hypothetical protein